MLAAEPSTRTNRVTLTPRRTPGFTLDEAARIRRDLLANATDVRCPRCAGQMATVRAGHEADATWMAGCDACRLSVVVHHRAGDLG